MKVGDYVRTKKGEIGKIIGYVDEPTNYYFNCYVTTLKTNFTDTYITEYDNNIKSSPNIIDILEEHDFVQMQDRGNRFYEIEEDYACKLSLRDIGWDEYEELDETNIPEIVSIITHEQMEQMKYKIGE